MKTTTRIIVIIVALQVAHILLNAALIPVLMPRLIGHINGIIRHRSNLFNDKETNKIWKRLSILIPLLIKVVYCLLQLLALIKHWYKTVFGFAITNSIIICFYGVAWLLLVTANLPSDAVLIIIIIDILWTSLLFQMAGLGSVVHGKEAEVVVKDEDVEKNIGESSTEEAAGDIEEKSV